jgi:hypothetical protein
MILKLLISILALTSLVPSLEIPLKFLLLVVFFSISLKGNSDRINDLFSKLTLSVLVLNLINVIIQFNINPDLSFSTDLFFGLFSRNTNPDDPALFYILENRNFTINLLFALSLYFYLSLKNVNYLKSIFYYSIIINALFGMLQLFSNYGRIGMSFSEPSSSGYYYCFMFFIVLHYFNSGEFKFFRNIFIPLGIVIFSKAQYISFAIWALLKSSLKVKILVVSLFLIILFGAIKINEVLYFRNFMSSFASNGVRGLSSEEDVKDSYIVRISGIYFGTRTFVKYPFGVGYNGFSILYNKVFSEDPLSEYINSWEINYILEKFTRASPKSNIINFIVSIGILSFFIFYQIFKYVKSIKQFKYLHNAFIMLFLVSFFAELNPMWIYLMFLFVLGEIEKRNLEEQSKKI